jgi:hypothetical protein
LPVATVSFDKNRYLNKVEHKDLRVFSGLKDDLTIENKGRDFAFSNILNPAGTYNLDLAGQAVVFIDKTEITQKTIKDIETIVKDNIKVGIIPHIVYLNRPKIMFAKCKKFSRELFFTIKVKQAPVWQTLKVYYAVNKTKISENDIELLALDVSGNLTTTTVEGDLVLENTISTEILESSSVPDNKLYFYTKWVSQDTTVESDTSSISCVHVK